MSDRTRNRLEPSSAARGPQTPPQSVGVHATAVEIAVAGAIWFLVVAWLAFGSGG
jgi:hypothetical protein